MTFSPEGPRPSGPDSGGYGNPYSPEGARPPEAGTSGYGAGYSPDNARSAAPGYSGYGQASPSYGGPAQQAQFGVNQPGSSSPSGQPYNPPLASDRPTQLPRILTLVVVVLGVVNFLVGLAGQFEFFGDVVNFFFVQAGDPTSIALLLAGGLVAAFGLLPRQANTIGIAAALSVAGWLVLVFQSFNTGDAGPVGTSIELGTGAFVVLVLGFVQSVLAVAATLFDAGVLKAPQPKPTTYGQQNFGGAFGQQASGYGQQNPNYAGYGQQQYGQPSPSQPSQNQASQNQAPQNQGYVPPAYTGPSQGQPNQNTTGSLGYPVGTSKPDAPQGGLTGPASQNSPYSQPHYGQPPVGSAGYGAPQHAVPPESEESEGDAPPYSAPTQAFGQTPSDDDKK